VDISFLRPMYAHPGPWISVYLDDSRDTDSAREEIGIRWRDARDDLAAAGAPVAPMDAAEQTLIKEPRRPGKHGAALFAGSDAWASHQWIPVPPPLPEARFDVLPHVVPMLFERGQQVSWLRVVVDRTGGLIEYAETGRIPGRRHVKGSESYPIRKIRPVDFAQGRFQREAETTWRRNTGQVADAIVSIADDLRPDVLLIAGDVHARRLLHEQLPARWQASAVLTDAIESRAFNADPQKLDDVTVQLIAETAAAQDDQTLDKLRQQSGEWSALGIEPAVDAMNRAQVDTLVLDPEKLAAWRLGITSDGLLDVQAHSETADAADALVRAAAMTGAGVVVLGPDETDPLPQGVGVVLRYRDESTRSGTTAPRRGDHRPR
jgi:release factor family 2